MSSPGRILIVDDDAVIRKVTSFLVKRLGYTAEAVDSGLEALARLQAQPFEVVLLDCQMPGWDGFQTAREIRSAGFHLPIVGLTGEEHPGARERCLEAGMSDYRCKPIQANDLSELLGELLGRSTEVTNFAEPTAGEDPLARVRAMAEASGNPALVKRLVASFVRSSEDSLTRLASATASDDRAQLHALAHKLKGTSGTFGAVQFSRLAQLLEDQPLDGDCALVQQLCQQLQQAWVALRAQIQA